MTEYKNTNFESRSRYVRRLQSKAAKKAHLQIFAIVSAIALAIVLISIILVNLFTKARKPETIKQEKPVVNILVMGIEQKEFEQYTTGYGILVYNPNEDQISVLSFPPETKVLIPGYGFDTVDKSMFGGLKSALATASNITGVKISRYVTMDLEDYEKSVTKEGVGSLFSHVINTKISEKEQVVLAKAFKEVDKGDINILEVPISKLKVGKEYHAQPKKSELNRLITVLWGEKRRRTKVIVLNGNGKTGIGGKVGQRLIDAGFEILDIKNAKSFSYKKTVIALYTLEKKKDAQKIKDSIKVGKVEPTVKNQNLTDITVIVGKDYR